MKTQPAAPPRIPPRHPRIGLAQADADDWRARHEDQARKLDECRALIDAVLAQTQANRARLRQLAEKAMDRLLDQDPPDA